MIYRLYLNDRGWTIAKVGTFSEVLDELEKAPEMIPYIVIEHDIEHDCDNPIMQGTTPYYRTTVDMKREILDMHDKHRVRRR